jgi:Protein of unknown function (DUF3617)
VARKTATTAVKRTIESLILLVALGDAIAGASVAGLHVRPGEYKVTIIYEIQGQTQGVSQNLSRCIGQDDLTNPERIFSDRASDGSKPDTSCAVKNLKYNGVMLSYDDDCLNRLAHVKGTLHNSEFHVVREIRTKHGWGVSFRLTLTGKRTGDCTRKGG